MLRLTYYSTTSVPLEAEIITPDQLAGKSPLEIAKLPVQHGNAPAPLGDFFHVEGDSADQHIRIDGDCTRVKLIGSLMKSGCIVVHGSVGMHLGAEMIGGEIQVLGNAADWVGAEMRGGLIHVHGDAGNLVGAGYRGSRLGMRGGVILIEGNAGNEIGANMRRGLIAVGGATGDFAGAGMIAGTLCLFGQTGARTGANMKRGTIALFGPAPPLLPTFRFDCIYRPMFMRIYLQQLDRWIFCPHHKYFAGNYRRYSGDFVAGAKGEILVHV